jgi:uncharacterized OsmC-like protein
MSTPQLQRRTGSGPASGLDPSLADSGPATSHAFFVTPTRTGDGFHASIRGHRVDLADPMTGDTLAPTPTDLLMLAIASEIAWSARALLRQVGLPDRVSVSGAWRTQVEAHKLELDLTLTVSTRAERVSRGLLAALDGGLVARTASVPLDIRICTG